MNTVLADTGFWIAFFDPSESDHQRAAESEWILDEFPLVVPWPILYETLRTRFVRRAVWVLQFETYLKRPNVEFIDDAAYRQEAYTLTVEYATRLRRDISMVDMLCRLLIEDRNVRIDYLLTTNDRDFADVCRANDVEII